MYNFQYYQGNIKQSLPIGWISMDRFIYANKNPKQHTIELFNQIAYYESIGDMATKAKLKERLYSFTPCVQLSGSRSYKNITAWTGLLVLDFDHIVNAIDFKTFLFENYNFILACWLSPSKHGVKALVKIPIVYSTDEFKTYFYGIAEEMWQYNGFDGSGQNCVLPLFQSNDIDLLYNSDSEIWNKQGFKKNDFIPSITQIQATNFTNKESVISKIIFTGIDKINDNGHPQLRSLCLSIGGYIANNYIDYNTAISIIYNRIESNHYLQKGISGYKKTAKWAVDGGMSKPLEI